jgi:hypothetical protein
MAARNVMFDSDVRDARNEKITKKTERGYVYSVQPDDELQKIEIPGNVRRSIRRRDIKSFYYDPYEENGQKVIPHTEEEIKAFNSVVNEQLMNKDFAKMSVYAAKKHSFLTADDDVPSDGTPAVKGTLDVTTTKALEELPEQIWIDPYCFLSGKFCAMLKWHKYTSEILQATLPQTILRHPEQTGSFSQKIAKELRARPTYDLEEIKRLVERGGTMHVQTVTIGDKRNPDFIQLGFRFTNVDEKQDAEDIKMSSQVHEDFNAITWDTITSLIEDRLRFNVIIVPDNKLRKDGSNERFAFACVFFST